jgi:hypothetical protein
MRPVTADEEQDFRIALEFNADDIEVPACALARPRARPPARSLPLPVLTRGNAHADMQ